MASTKRKAEGPVGEELPTKKVKLTESNEGPPRLSHLLAGSFELTTTLIRLLGCPYGRPSCVHGRALHHVTVVGETYGIDQGVTIWCGACNIICDFELFSGPHGVPQPEFTSGNDLVVDEADEIIESPLEVLFLGNSRRASGLHSQNAYP
ncbi:hypothetical protein M407DRAFT_22336 [Tulasnella calospora MUT 4182]|uniref:Uncharacterized protein n=1 Tax=Tulasnella calospora MUT 4182 TaxID=1051891 RepID=A0A0C3QN62_9AGAM|nr:hypothetical protein M407DRAFT_22336 [Tulasnella calospora MUT 4182]